MYALLLLLLPKRTNCFALTKTSDEDERNSNLLLLLLLLFLFERARDEGGEGVFLCAGVFEVNFFRIEVTFRVLP